jgi:hypothetical protein
LFIFGGRIMELQKLTSLKDIKVGDLFTMITPNFEDLVIQFVGRNPMISSEEFKYKSGYFVTVYGPKKCFILEEDDLRNKDTEYYIGHDEKFALERRIEKIQNNLLIPLQDQLLKLKEYKTEKS